MRNNTECPGSDRASLLGQSIIFALIGCGLFAATAVTVLGVLPGIDSTVVAWLASAAIAGLIARGLRRKTWFGPALSMHQALSFEVVVQTVQWFSPGLPSRRFETEFLVRETGLERNLIAAWIQSRRRGLPAVAFGAVAALLWLADLRVAALLMTLASVAAIGVGATDLRRQDVAATLVRRHVGATLAGILAWTVEASLFVVATSGLFGLALAFLLYSGFTIAVEIAAIPLALGIAEIPALFAIPWDSATSALCVLVVFHTLRLLVLLALAAVYLPRYKLSLDDLFDRNLIARLAASQRPAGGWNLEPGQAESCAVSVIIPAYNEAERLPPFLTNVVSALEAYGRSWEVIVVDDGSADRTAGLVRQVSTGDTRVRLLINEHNLGKGGAIARGVRAATGQHVLFADADGATPAAEIAKLIDCLDRGSDIVIGSRRLQADNVQLERESLRALIGSTFYRLVNFLAVPGIQDTQCGFKAFRRDIAVRLFDGLTETGWAFDVEILYRAQLAGFAITEIPVNWSEVDGSKLNPVRDAFRMGIAIFSIRRRNAGFLGETARRCTPPDTRMNDGAERGYTA